MTVIVFDGGFLGPVSSIRGRWSKEWVDIATERLKAVADPVLKIYKRPMFVLSVGVDSRLVVPAFLSVGRVPLMVTIGDGRPRGPV